MYKVLIYLWDIYIILILEIKTNSIKVGIKKYMI